MKRLALIIVLMMVLSSTDGCSKQAEDENGVSTETAAESPIALLKNKSQVKQYHYKESLFLECGLDTFTYEGDGIRFFDENNDFVCLGSIYQSDSINGYLFRIKENNPEIISPLLYSLSFNEDGTRVGNQIYSSTRDKNENYYIIYSNYTNGDVSHSLSIMDKNFNAIEDGIPFEATEFWSTDCVFYNDMIYTTTYESGLVANDLSGKKVDIPIGLTNHYNFNNLSVDATGNLYFRGNELTTGLQAYIKYDLNTNTILYESKVSESRIGFSNAYYNAAVQNIYTANDSGVYRYNADTGEYIGTELTFGVDTSYQISDNLWIVDVLTDNDGNIYMILYDDSGEERLCKIFKYTLAAGDKPEEEDINEIVFTANYIQDYILQAIANYNLRNSEIIIKPDVTYGTRQEMLNSLEQAAANFATRIMANDVGDIVATGGMGLDYYNILHTDAFVDLTDYIRNDKSYADLNHSALASLTFDGKLNGLPVGLVLYNYLDFNTQLNDELQLGLNPHSLKWSELLNAAKSLETGRENLMLYGSSDIDVLLSEILITNMPNLIDLEAKTYDLKQDWFIKLINGLKEVRDLDNLTSNSTSTPFLFRQIASPGLIAPYSYRWDVETVPAVSGEVNRNNLMYTNHLYSISARSQNKDAAWEFLSFLIEEDQMTMDSLGGVPLNNKALDKLLASFDEDRQIFYREITGNIDILYDFGLYKEDIVTPVMEFINDNITLDEALEDAEYNIWLRMNE